MLQKRLAILALVSLVAACTATSDPGDTECSETADCDEGWVCIDGACLTVCINDFGCDYDEQCDNGTCSPVPNPDCTALVDCNAPAACELAEGADCVAGRCLYRSQGDGTNCHTSHGDAGVCASGTCVPHCLSPADCDNPGPCEESAGVTCTAGVCTYPTKPEATRCQRAADPVGQLNGYCVAGVCRDCLRPQDCAAPAVSYPECFEILCVNYSCVALVNDTVECEAAGCVNAIQSDARTCGPEGLCPTVNQTACAPFDCDPTGTVCLATCGSDNDCGSGTFCNPTSSQCEPLLNDGVDCTGLPSSACMSGNCQNNICCNGTHCCSTPADCPPSYSEPSECRNLSTATNCQGDARQATCVQAVCGTTLVSDDSGCDPAARDCFPFAAVECTSEVDQSPPTCPTSCTSPSDCASGYTCQGTSCVKIQGVGNACTGGPGQGNCNTGLQCDNGVCCDAAALSCCQNDSHCNDGLACNTGASQCYESCVPDTTTRCSVPLNNYCSDGSRCVAKLSTTSACTAPVQCQTGFCVDGICCATECAGACDGCAQAITGVANGTCASIDGRTHQGACDGDGNGNCGGNACECRDGDCLRQNGEFCTLPDQCAGGYCECGDAGCSTAGQRCADGGCSECTYTTNGETCPNNLNATVACTLPGGQTGACGNGICLLTLGAPCASQNDDHSCASGHCECGDQDCETFVCASEACPACRFAENNSGTWTCSGYHAYSTVCGIDLMCNSSGACRSTNGTDCDTDSNCASGHCECASSTCAATKCNNVACGGCRYDTSDFGDTICQYNVNNFDRGGCSAPDVCYNGNCTPPGSCACTCSVRCSEMPRPKAEQCPGDNYVCYSRVSTDSCGAGFTPACGSCGSYPGCASSPSCTCGAYH